MIFFCFFRIHHNGYSSLPRNSSSKMAGNSNMDRMSQLQDQKVARSKSSVSLSHDTPRRPTSAASSVASAKRASPRPGSRQGHGAGASHKTMNASMSIWQIQKELKRGEMVQVNTLQTTFKRYSSLTSTDKNGDLSLKAPPTHSNAVSPDFSARNLLIYLSTCCALVLNMVSNRY